jgi:hypothetical protein
VIVSYPVEELQRFGYQQELRRALRVRALIAYGLIMVPIAPMAIFGAVFSASAGMMVLAYGIGMAALVFTAFSHAQPVKAFVLSGSVYNYVGCGIGAPAGSGPVVGGVVSAVAPGRSDLALAATR